jgi:hypothetical protein
MPSIIHASPAVFHILVGGIDVSNVMNKYLINLTVIQEFSEDSKCTMIFDDSGGQLRIPDSTSKIEVGLGWQDTGPVEVFGGYQAYTTSKGSRPHGRTLTVDILAEDMGRNSPLKATINAHADDKSFEDAGNQFAPLGYKLIVKGGSGMEPLGSKPQYWAISQTWPQWIESVVNNTGGGGWRVIAKDKIFVVVPAGSDQGLPSIECDCADGGNVIDWSITPDDTRFSYEYMTLFYNNPEAVLQSVLNTGAFAASSIGYAAAKAKIGTEQKAQDSSAGARMYGDNAEKQGTLTMVGEPAAVVQGRVKLVGARDGIDGLYVIDRVEHTYSRSGGFVTHLDLSNPTDAAVFDSFVPPPPPPS